ncbi:type VI secretion system secreted protein VgrG [Noviherbaspirillum humi]|uniref:Type VI secretion system secreted protein VgrG n=1 Tax=Noviherbaspirillum humi TaxID=1688639 RepID=A0A239CHF5_9BURK|nr:type VI secretion system Vgr family protein [Noviherbaspirillum humi]SNS19312.1 type VI secretion system secreted protein VgrG [Noviherbaspirillum humi]
MSHHERRDRPSRAAALDSRPGFDASPFTQQRRLITLRFAEDSDLEADSLLPQRLRGVESISGGYLYLVDVLSANAFIEAKQVLGQTAELAILLADGKRRLVSGIVTAFGPVASDGGFTRYALQMEPCLALLAHRFNACVRQNMTVPDVIRDVMQRHVGGNPVFARAFQVEFRLTQDYPVLSYCNQYEFDLHFLDRLMAEYGLFHFFEFRADNDCPVHVMVVADDPFVFAPAMQATVRYAGAHPTTEEDVLTGWSALRRVQPGLVHLTSYDYKTASVEQAGERSRIDQGKAGNSLASTLEDFDPLTHYYASGGDRLERHALLRQQAHDFEAKQFSAAGCLRGAAAGTWFELRDHPVHDQQNAEQRQFLILLQAVEASNNYLDELNPQAQRLMQAGVDLPLPLQPWFNPGAGFDARGGQLLFRNRMRCARRGQPVRPRFGHGDLAKPTAPGPMTAIVVGPEGEEIHTDDLGRIKIQFDWQLPQNHPQGGAGRDERSSAWVRMVHPSAGAAWGTQYLPRVGQEVAILFLHGDIDRPVCLGALHNGIQAPPHFSGAGSLPANKALSGTRTRELRGSRANQLRFDDSSGQISAQLMSEHAATELNQGWLGTPRQEGKSEPRGEGFELITDAAGAVRAARGLLLTAWSRLQDGRQLERAEFERLLDECHALFAQLGDYAARHKAQPVDGKPQETVRQHLRDWENGSNARPGASGGGQPLIGMTAPAGLGFATPAGIVSYAGRNLDSVAQQHLQLAAGQRISLNAGAGMSLFAQSEGLKAIAHQGRLQLQAQHDDVELQAEQHVRISASQGKIIAMAQQEVVFMTSGGAYIKLSGADIEFGCPGTLKAKAASHQVQGPASASADLPSFARGDLSRTPQLIRPGDGRPIDGARYRIGLPEQPAIEGRTDALGNAAKVDADKMKNMAVRFFEPDEGSKS